MSTDPLEKATRDAKRNLLLISVAIITVKAFSVTIHQIPLAGLSINFDPGALGFLLAAGMLYFLTTFILYYYVDVRNLEATKHQEGHARNSRDAPQRYQSKLNEKIAEKIKGVIPSTWILSLSSGNPQVATAVHAKQIFGGLPGQVQVDVLERVGDKSLKYPTRESDPEIFEKIDILIARNTRTFWWRIKANEIWHRISNFRVILTYYFRIYFVDGIFPALVAIYALAALFNLVSLEWIRAYSPTLAVKP